MGCDILKSFLVGLCHTKQANPSPQTVTGVEKTSQQRKEDKFRTRKTPRSKRQNKPKSFTRTGQTHVLGTLLALEPRIMFDGAALATGAEVLQDTTSQNQSEVPGIDSDTTTDSTHSDSSNSDSFLASGLSLSTPSDRKEIIFIDTRVEDYQTLLNGIDPGAEAILLDSTRDGIEQIAEVLRNRSDIDAIHLISHGNQGELFLGTGTLSVLSMQGEYADELAIIKQALGEEADVLIYGCNFGQGAGGTDAASLLAELIGADIAASDDLTGSTELGADWELEVRTGTIDTAIGINAQAQGEWKGVLTNLTDTGEFTVNAASGNSEETSGPTRGAERAVDMAPNGDYVVVWTDATSSDKVLAKVLDKDGNDKVAQFQVNVAGGNNAWADVAMDDNGNFVVTWTQDNDVYMRRFQADGTAIDAAGVQVNTTTANIQQNSSININGAGDFVLAWEGSGGGNEGIFVRQGSIAGGLTGSDITVNTTTAAQDPSVGIADSGDFVVVWDDGTGDVFFQQYNSGAVAQNSGQVDVALQANAGGAAVGMSGDGRFTVAYRATIVDLGIYVRQFDATGNAQGLPQIVNTSTTNAQTNPSISMNDSGDVIIVWEGNGTQAGNIDADGVFGQKFDSSGNKIGSEFLVNQTTANVQDRASVAILDRDNFVVVWTGSDGAQTDVYARQYGVSTTAPNVDLDTNNSSGATGNDYQFTFTEGDGPTSIADTDTDLVDADSVAFSYVKLAVTGLLDGNAETLALDGDTFALATANAGQDTTGGNYRVVIATGAGTATVTITKQGGGTFTETETETLIKTIQYQHTDATNPTDGNRLIDVTVNDGILDSPIARTTINVNPVNALPVAVTDSFTLNEGATATLNLAGNDTDADDGLDLTSLTIVSGPTNGTITSINNDGTVEYSHNGSETTSDSFTYTIKDLTGTTSNTVAVTLTITPQNDAPIITSNGGSASANVSVITGTTAVTDVNASDAESPTLTYSITGGADAALFTIDPATGVLTFITAPDFNAPSDVGADNVYDVIVQSSDGTAVDTQALAVTVTQVPPVLVTPPPPEPTPEATPKDHEADQEGDTAIGGNAVGSSSGFSSNAHQGSTANALKEGNTKRRFTEDVFANLQPHQEAMNIVDGVSDMVEALKQSLVSSTTKNEIQSLWSSSSRFLKDLDGVRDALNGVTASEKTYMASSIAVTTGLSVGYVIWLLRSGVLLTALLTSVPAWQFVNPLLILATPARKKGHTDLEDDSIESMFEQPSVSATPSETKDTAQDKKPRSRWLRGPWR